MAIMVGSFTLQLPTSASVATLHAFAKPLRYRMFGGNSLMLGGFERCEVLIRFFFCSRRSLIMGRHPTNSRRRLHEKMLTFQTLSTVITSPLEKASDKLSFDFYYQTITIR